MFNLFRKNSDSDGQSQERQLERRAEAPRSVSPIASLQMMHETAVATLTVTELAHETGSQLLADLLETLASSGARHFILDMQNVQFMDTPCLGCLVQATNALAKRGGRIALVNPDHGVSYLFKLTKLDRVFPICNDVPAALHAVEGTPDKDGESFWGRLAG
jgi:anti-sigma B factor antagonist